MSYKVIDKCKISDYDLGLYYFIKKHFESEFIKIVLVVNVEPEQFGYFVEIRKMFND